MILNKKFFAGISICLPKEKRDKEIIEYFPLHINKEKFNIGDTIFAYGLVKITTISKYEPPVTEYLEGHLRAVVQSPKRFY